MKNRRLFVPLCISALAALCASCAAGGVKYSRTVSVNGRGIVPVQADRAALSFAVVTGSADVAAASAENARIMTDVQAALRGQGIPADMFSTGDYRIYQESSYNNGRNIRGDYRVSNELTVVVTDTAKVGAVIDAAIGAGANELSSLRFSVSDTSAAVREARVLAMEQAAESASLLAGTAGAELGKVVSIQENSFPAPRFQAEGLMMKAQADAAPGTPVSAGTSEVEVSVSVVYELK